MAPYDPSVTEQQWEVGCRCQLASRHVASACPALANRYEAAAKLLLPICPAALQAYFKERAALEWYTDKLLVRWGRQ